MPPYIVSGMLYGIVLASFMNKQSSNWEKAVFIIAATAINFYCAYQVDFMNEGKGASLRIFEYSGIGSILLRLSYDLLLSKKFSILYVFIITPIFCVAGSALSALCVHILQSGNYNEFVSTILWLGMFSIFPIWQCLFGLSIHIQNKDFPLWKIHQDLLG